MSTFDEIKARADAIRTAHPGYAESSRKAARAAAEQTREDETCTAASATPSTTSTPSPATSPTSPRRSRPATAGTARRSRAVPAPTTPPSAPPIADILALLRAPQIVPESSEVPVAPVSAPAPSPATPQPAKVISVAHNPKRDPRLPAAIPTLSISLSGDMVEEAWDALLTALKPTHVTVSRGEPGPQDDYRQPGKQTVRYNLFEWHVK